MNHKILKNLVLITQFSISIMVPIFLLLIVGIFIRDRFNIDLIVLFLVIGVLSGMRNGYVLIMQYVKQM